MSNRIPSLAQSAVDKAWENEYYLVLEGRGTRDWTPEQQNQILTLGKAYDENGNPFEGHHMMSVEEYPELQGNPDNIQFLSREEHLAAHEGNFQNPTNSYYDAETGESYPIEDPEQLPYLERDLSEPVETDEDEDLDGVDESRHEDASVFAAAAAAMSP